MKNYGERRVLGQSVQSLPRTPEEVELLVVAGGTAALSGLLFMIGAREQGADKVAAYGVASVFVLAGLGAAVKLCQGGK